MNCSIFLGSACDGRSAYLSALKVRSLFLLCEKVLAPCAEERIFSRKADRLQNLLTLSFSDDCDGDRCGQFLSVFRLCGRWFLFLATTDDFLGIFQISLALRVLFFFLKPCIRKVGITILRP